MNVQAGTGRVLGFAGGICLLLAAAASAEDAVRPGEVIEEAPTVICLGVRWLVEGDDNRNAAVRVRYRPEGAGEWNEGLPLLRVEPEGIAYGRKTPNMFAGSVFDLVPGSFYEVRLTLTDPDGGDAEEIVRMRTRPVPKAAPDARVLPVEPARLQEAFNEALPGDILLVSPGTFSGMLDVRAGKGTLARPIVIRAAEEGEVVLDGAGEKSAVNACGSEHVYLEGLVLRGARWSAVQAEAAVGLVVRRCRMEGLKQGVYNADKKRPGRDFYIADNVIIGPYRWPTKGIFSEEGVQLCGTGHVVCHNRVRGWSDGISILDQRGEPYPCRAIDFYNNDISECTDDAIEMDTGEHNVRAFRNRITDCHVGITNQPIYGGPCYIFRNVMYNLMASPFKMHNNTSGLVICHNTVIRSGAGGEGGRAAFLHYTNTPVRNAQFRNNIFLTNGSRAIESWGNFLGCDLDYNGYNEGGVAFTRDGASYKGPSFAEFVERTGFERHSRFVDLSIFAEGIDFPEKRTSHVPPDLRLREGSAALDAGSVLPNINDGFRGEAPDLGAYELGDELPTYGPRTEGVDEATEAAARIASAVPPKEPEPAAPVAALEAPPAPARGEPPKAAPASGRWLLPAAGLALLVFVCAMLAVFRKRRRSAGPRRRNSPPRG